MKLNDLTDEQIARARECKSPEEMSALFKELGIKLSDAELDAISGGSSWFDDSCNNNRPPAIPV